MEAYAQQAHDVGALFITIVDPISLGMFKPPREYETDIVGGEVQALGNPISFGGPGLGIFACRKEYVHQMPGRIVGKTLDEKDIVITGGGHAGYVAAIHAAHLGALGIILLK